MNHVTPKIETESLESLSMFATFRSIAICDSQIWLSSWKFQATEFKRFYFDSCSCLFSENRWSSLTSGSAPVRRRLEVVDRIVLLSVWQMTNEFRLAANRLVDPQMQALLLVAGVHLGWRASRLDFDTNGSTNSNIKSSINSLNSKVVRNRQVHTLTK